MGVTKWYRGQSDNVKQAIIGGIIGGIFLLVATIVGEVFSTIIDLEPENGATNGRVFYDVNDQTAPGTIPGNPVVVMETTLGNVTMELFADQAPLSVRNFLRYAYAGFYEDTIFHRVIENFMIQGGGMGTNMVTKTTREPIMNEATNGLSNQRGTVAMARKSATINSATSQFFINHVNNGHLDHGGAAPHAVFGRVTDGMDVVDAIARVQTTARGGHQDVPVTPVVINAMTVQPQGSAEQ